MTRRPAFAGLLAFLAIALPAPPAAAETWATCTGTIASLPATISTQGVWCLDHDLATSVVSGIAINITTNNVTIDCNGFKLGNLAAGIGTAAVGIQSLNRRNTTVRNCAIRGFATGINLTGSVVVPVTSAGHLAEDNLVEGSTIYGVLVKGVNSTVRRNRVFDIGQNANSGPAAIAAIGTVDVLDNLVDGVVAATGTVHTTWGIYANPNNGTVIARNHVRGVTPALGVGWDIFVAGIDGALTTIRDNVVVNTAPGTIWSGCSPAYSAVRRDNVMMGTSENTASDCYSFGDVYEP